MKKIQALNIEYAYAQENVEIAAYKHKHYGHGVHYDSEKETYDQAYDRAAKIMWDKIKKDNSQIQWHDEVIQVEKFVPPPIENLKWVNNSNAPISKSEEKIKSATIEERNYHSPDIETIKKEIQSYKYGVKALKSIYGEMVKDNTELKKVFDEKVKELEQKKSIV